MSELRHTGTLRRSHSAELVSELGDSEGEVEYRGLRIHSQPKAGPQACGAIRTRVRHNSDGNYDDVSLMQETILREHEGQEEEEEEEGEDRVYQNLEFHRASSKPEQRLAELICPADRLGGGFSLGRPPASSPGSSLASLNSLGLPTPRPSPRPSLPSCGLPLTSDSGSLDSHNDSGYSTRLGVSDTASPSLSGSIGERAFSLSILSQEEPC